MLRDCWLRNSGPHANIKLQPKISMDKDDIATMRALLIKFGKLPKCKQTEFLSRINRFMYASPQYRKQLLRKWEEDQMLATATVRQLPPMPHRTA
jgi:hypothetical protein